MYKQFLKHFIFYFLHILYIFPVSKNRCLFESFAGRTVSCNPLYIYKELCKKNKMNFIWVYNGKKSNLMNYEMGNIKFIKFKSLKYIYFCMTSKVFVNNGGIPGYIPFRKSQLIIETWHGGGAYKKVESDLKAFSSVSFFISSSKYFSEKVVCKSFHVNESKILPIGMPRNDILFNLSKMNQVKTRVREKYGIPVSTLIVLYAPTFRGLNKKSFFNDELNYKKIKQVFEKKFKKKVVFFIRKHHLLQDKNIFNLSNENYFFDVSTYQDVQELICASDILISDYSSVVWDFSLTYKPIFLFVPDFSEYSFERGFYISPKEWGMPFSKTNEELCENINCFDYDDYKVKIKEHHDLLQSYETGKATEKLCKVIENFLGII